MQHGDRERQVCGDYGESGELEGDQSDCDFRDRDLRWSRSEMPAIAQVRARMGLTQCYFRVNQKREMRNLETAACGAKFNRLKFSYGLLWYIHR